MASDNEEAIIAQMIREAHLRANTDPKVHAEIEQTRQILARLVKAGWVDDEVQDLISSAAAIAITLHDPMDGRPFL